ncbi:MAG: type II restriction endonuclease [Neisseriaceae bacterium]|nr:type II restriction endonuclease [Neisseriaceae bacterium]
MAVNEMNFNDFLKSLKQTNRTLDYFTDFGKCQDSINKISMKLHSLNFLLGKQDLKFAVNELFLDNPKCFEVLNLLIAVRDKKEILLNNNDQLVSIGSYFNNPEKIYEFLCATGLKDIFVNGKIKNLHDYVFGIEVGLDTNARKNRTGHIMEILLANIFTHSHLKFEEQVDIEKLNLSLGDDIKRFDFVITTKSTKFLIETNFYNGGGSKLNETARAYTEIEKIISQHKDYQFVWITDGQGWLSAKNKLKEAYKTVKIYNLSNIDKFIQWVKTM